MSLFEGCILYISPRSPFARRVRLAFLEHKINFNEQVCDVFNLPSDYVKLNPLMRVPVAILKNRQEIVDSHALLQVLYQEQNGGPLMPATAAGRVNAAHWSGLAVGLCEFAVQHFLEGLRKENKSSEILDEYTANIKNTVMACNAFLKNREFIAESLSQADLDLGTALTYLSLRHSWNWKIEYPTLVSYLERLELRESFIKTKPPA